MRTMPRRYPGSSRGDYRRMCDICGAMYHRTDLTRKPDMFFYCPDCASETDRVTLSEEQAENATEVIFSPWIED